MKISQLFPFRSQILDLPARDCQFHAGHKNDQGFLVFCGEPLKPGSSYCGEHHRKVYQRGASMKSAHVVIEVAAEPTDVAVPELEREAA